jgi:hypothetical protein
VSVASIGCSHLGNVVVRAMLNGSGGNVATKYQGKQPKRTMKRK